MEEAEKQKQQMEQLVQDNAKVADNLQKLDKRVESLEKRGAWKIFSLQLNVGLSTLLFWFLTVLKWLVNLIKHNWKFIGSAGLFLWGVSNPIIKFLEDQHDREVKILNSTMLGVVTGSQDYVTEADLTKICIEDPGVIAPSVINFMEQEAVSKSISGTGTVDKVMPYKAAQIYSRLYNINLGLEEIEKKNLRQLTLLELLTRGYSVRISAQEIKETLYNRMKNIFDHAGATTNKDTISLMEGYADMVFYLDSCFHYPDAKILGNYIDTLGAHKKIPAEVYSAFNYSEIVCKN